MLRSLLLVAVPFTTLLASEPTLDKYPFLGAMGHIQPEPIPFKAAIAAAEPSVVTQFKAAAENGDRDAQLKLGTMYYWGQDGVAQDYNAAQIWLRRASEQGDRDAQAKLGAMYFLGQGGPRNPEESLKWFHRAAEQGEPYAQGCIGVMFAVGEGVPQDLLEAYVWLAQAKDGGDEEALEPFQQVKLHLTPAQIQEGDRRVRAAVKKRATN